MAYVQLDSETAELLSGIDSYFVQQRVRWVEAVTQGCCEQTSIYDVFEKETNRKIFVIQEESNDLNRCCCAPEHSFFSKFYLVDDTTGEPRGNAVMTMEREGCDCFDPCPKPCLCCFACTPGCSDGAVLYAGDLGESPAPGSLKGARDRSNMLGETIQPINGGKFKPVVQLMERGDDGESHQFAAARGPCFFGGCSELCCDSEFGISKAKDGMGVDEIHQLTFDYAHITKIRPRNFTQALREAFTDSDLYNVTFHEAGVTPQQKANVLASMVMMEYMFFERDNDMITCDSDGVYITVCNCFCYGCICPCTINVAGGGDSGGGGE